MGDNYENSTEKRAYAQLQNEQIEFEHFNQGENQSEDQTRASTVSHGNGFEIHEDRPQHFGNNMIFKVNTLTGQPKYTLGPHWPLFLCAWGSFVAVDFFLIRMMWNNSDNILWVVLTCFICALHTLSYLFTALANPGIAHKNDEITRQLKKMDNLTLQQMESMYCQKCDLLKDTRTEHCDSCDVCVRGYDHHCPWSSKCIAKGNIKPFNVFITMTFIFMAYAIVITVTTLLPMNRRSGVRRPNNPDNYYNSTSPNF